MELIERERMNRGSTQMEVHYIETGFPYTATESFMDFFEDLAHEPVNFPFVGTMHDQDENTRQFQNGVTDLDVHFDNNTYWSVNMNAYKYGFSGPESNYFSPLEANDHLSRVDVSTRTWDYFSAMDQDLPAGMDEQSREDALQDVPAVPEECFTNQENYTSSQVAWQDGIDPDNMTYEELLDLGEAVGTQSRGLSKELIDLLPTSKYKLGSFFHRKKSRERCVICQMRYKLGEKQMKLPCKHVYHSECITKWLSINKICPVCNHEVFGGQSD